MNFCKSQENDCACWECLRQYQWGLECKASGWKQRFHRPGGEKNQELTSVLILVTRTATALPLWNNWIHQTWKSLAKSMWLVCALAIRDALLLQCPFHTPCFGVWSIQFAKLCIWHICSVDFSADLPCPHPNHLSAWRSCCFWTELDQTCLKLLNGWAAPPLVVHSMCIEMNVLRVPVQHQMWASKLKSGDFKRIYTWLRLPHVAPCPLHLSTSFSKTSAPGAFRKSPNNSWPYGER